MEQKVDFRVRGANKMWMSKSGVEIHSTRCYSIIRVEDERGFAKTYKVHKRDVYYV